MQRSLGGKPLPFQTPTQTKLIFVSVYAAVLYSESILRMAIGLAVSRYRAKQEITEEYKKQSTIELIATGEDNFEYLRIQTIITVCFLTAFIFANILWLLLLKFKKSSFSLDRVLFWMGIIFLTALTPV